MNNYMNIGEVIRAARREKHMSQTELAKGICSKDYIYAIENNKNTPSGYILEQLSRKLDFDLYEYYKAVCRHISWTAHLHIVNLNEYMTTKDLERLETEVQICSTMNEFSSGEPLQHLLFAKSFLESELNHNIPTAINLCRQALEVFKPNFQIDTLKNSNFSNAELMILSQLAYNYMNIDCDAESIIIYSFLYSKLNYLCKLRIFDLNLNRNTDCYLFLITCLNLSVLEIRRNNYNKADSYIQIGLTISNRANDSTWLPAFLLCRCHLECIRNNIKDAATYFLDAKTLCKYSAHSQEIENNLVEILDYYPQLNEYM